MSAWGIYLFPFAVDIVVALILFVGRHALAAQGASETVVATIPVAFGLGYTLSGPVMRRIIQPRHARAQMVIALLLVALAAVALAAAERIWVIQLLFVLIPLFFSLFFNAFQSFMLGVSLAHQRSLHSTVGLYTFSWSLGFAMGPFACSLALLFLDWSQTYYVAAVASVLIAGCVALFRPAPPAPRVSALPAESLPARRPLLIPGWLGLVIGLVGWLLIATYWPVIASIRDVSPSNRGWVEFAWAISLACFGLLISRWQGWHFKPWAVAGFGLLAVGALLVFGSATSMSTYLVASSLMGMFAATTFTFSLLHCMSEPRLAAARVAVNEMMVGVSYLLGPVIAATLHSGAEDHGLAFNRAAVLLGGAVLIQLILMFRALGKSETE